MIGIDIQYQIQARDNSNPFWKWVSQFVDLGEAKAMLYRLRNLDDGLEYKIQKVIKEDIF
tara:strand:+ start:484 stop:663 length:180 start_codon:yes stop_codon:yes gene_type:complete